MSLERKLRRKQATKAKKSAEKEMAAKVALFGKMDDKCLTCQKSFNRMDKEQVMTWNVVVREEEDKVNLYCPNCWEKAMEIIQGLQERFNKKKENL